MRRIDLSTWWGTLITNLGIKISVSVGGEGELVIGTRADGRTWIREVKVGN